ncbi:hypothetical protein GOB94_15235 [Granulicella sp. 5B5]|uniref:universal stress protein n=1 Tax=Granulicella sp. 5B5 TaxID=1617967 RepID=UPI0015F3549C|nr:universal stress protein [Granulicella sp. 5B5]QMV19880.1 hypothetical protein GOB94_15235 [Granulicella sp. 5B5]
MQTHFEKRALAAPDRILVATDLSDTEYLVPHAIAQAKASGAQVTLIHALPPSDVVPMDAATIPYVDKIKIVRDLRVVLLGLAREFESRGIPCESAVRDGDPADVIPQEINRTHATRLIIGSHGRGRLGQLTLGSVARDLVPAVNIPVFVVGPHAQTGVRHATPQRILHPVSLGFNYRESLHLALDIAQVYRAELILLHVLDPDVAEKVDPQRTIDWADDALRALIPDASKLAPPVRTTVVSGKLAEVILKTSNQTKADWIVLGADGAPRGWPFHQSVAYKVLSAASCPVITLRHERARNENAVDFKEVHFTSYS